MFDGDRHTSGARAFSVCRRRSGGVASMSKTKELKRRHGAKRDSARPFGKSYDPCKRLSFLRGI